MVKAVVRSGKRHGSGTLGEDKVFPALHIVWSVASADRCSMADPVVRFCPGQSIGLEVLAISSTSPTGADVYDVYLDAKSDGNLLDIRPSSAVNVFRDYGWTLLCVAISAYKTRIIRVRMLLSSTWRYAP